MLQVKVKEQCAWSVGQPIAFFYTHISGDGYPDKVIELPEDEAYALEAAFPALVEHGEIQYWHVFKVEGGGADGVLHNVRFVWSNGTVTNAVIPRNDVSFLSSMWSPSPRKKEVEIDFDIRPSSIIAIGHLEVDELLSPTLGGGISGSAWYEIYCEGLAAPIQRKLDFTPKEREAVLAELQAERAEVRRQFHEYLAQQS